VSVVGLGKLGLPLAVAAASRGFQVIGHDHDPRCIDRLHAGEFPREPQVAQLAARYRGALTFTGDLARVRDASLTFLVVPTPSRRDGSYEIGNVRHALAALGRALRPRSESHVVALVSTVLPGDMARLRASLDRGAGPVAASRIGLVYNPAFIALGSVVHDLLHPDLVLIGEAEPHAGDVVEAFHRRLCEGEPSVHRMNWVNAELAKISVNAFVTMKISFANTIARLCERVPGAHADVVSEAIGADRRIGRLYLKGALGYGGPCFPRDNRAFSRAARARGQRSLLAEATDRINDQQLLALVSLVRDCLRGRERVTVLGVAYKADTDVIDASLSVALVRMLVDCGCRVTIWDPLALDKARAIFGDCVVYGRSLEDSVSDADVTVVATPSRAFKRLRAVPLGVRATRRAVIIDCWRLFERTRLAAQVDYVPLGVGPVESCGEGAT
jgi:UDPglucose 6-dehydrogenase